MKNCEQCQLTFEPKVKKQIFCSRRCNVIHKNKNRVNRWKGGKARGSHKTNPWAQRIVDILSVDEGAIERFIKLMGR